jgi:hypothetical protein
VTGGSETDNEILATVEAHYRQWPDRPYYASELGKHIRDSGLHIPTGVTIINYIRSRLEGQLYVVQDPKVPARIAVATRANQERISSIIEGRGKIPGLDELDFQKIQFALVAAFCRPPVEGKRLFFSIRRPFQYHVLTEAPQGDYIEITESDQPPDLRGVDVHKLNDEQRLDVYKHILRWAEKHEVDLRVFYISDHSQHSQPHFSQTKAPAPSGMNALERLVAIQDDDIKSRIKIPGDLIQILLKIP